MQVVKCALGVIQNRGQNQIPAQLMTLGADESDYFAKHVSAVRKYNAATALADFAPHAGTPAHLATLRTTAVDADFVTASIALQNLLAGAMRAAPRALDCVFATLRTTNADTHSPHVTVLKLDAVIEAAQWRMLAGGHMDFRVLRDLLPEPGDLQKGLSWPDPRTDSAVMTVDRNSVSAAYFESAYQLQVGLRGREAEVALIQAITDALPPSDVPAALSQLEVGGRLDEALDGLAETFPALAEAAEQQHTAPRPAAHIRPSNVAGRTLVWTADGIKVTVPGHLLSRVTPRRAAGGWELVITTNTEPKLGPK